MDHCITDWTILVGLQIFHYTDLANYMGERNEMLYHCNIGIYTMIELQPPSLSQNALSPSSPSPPPPHPPVGAPPD